MASVTLERASGAELSFRDSATHAQNDGGANDISTETGRTGSDFEPWQVAKHHNGRHGGEMPSERVRLEPPRDEESASANDISAASSGRGKTNRVLHVLLNVLLAALLALAGAVAIIPRLTGAVPLTVLSGSMQPTYHPGDLIVVRPTAAENLNIGDVVTFQPQSGVATLVTHRIIDITHDNQNNIVHIITQGDANNAADQPLLPEQIMGRVWYSVPLIGHVTNGSNALIAISGIGLALVIYAVVLFVKKDETDE